MYTQKIYKRYNRKPEAHGPKPEARSPKPKARFHEMTLTLPQAGRNHPLWSIEVEV